MSNFDNYVSAANLVYKDKLVDIADKNGEIVYRSPKMEAMLKINQVDKNIDSHGVLDSLEKILSEFNKKVIVSLQPNKFLCMGYIEENKPIIAHGVKHPIIENKKLIGIFTILQPVKAIAYEKLHDAFVGQEYTFELDIPQKLNDVEKEILFFSSIGFTQSEIFDLMSANTSSLHNLNSIDNIKYYCFSLLKKFNAESFDNIINNIAELKYKRFIPKSLVKNNGIVLK